MTTANNALGSAIARASEPYSIIRTGSARTRFATYWMMSQAVADYLSVVAGVFVASSFCEMLGFGPRPGAWNSVFLTANYTALFTLLTFRHLRLYDSTFAVLNIREVENIIRGIGLVFLGVVVALFFYGGNALSRPMVLLAGATVLFGVLGQRHLMFNTVRWAHQNGYGVRRVVIYGASHGIGVFRRIERNPRLGLTCIGFVDDDERAQRHLVNLGIDRDVLGTWRELREIVATHEVEEIIVADAAIAREKFLGIMSDCEQLKVGVSFVPDLFGPYQQWFSFQLVDGLPFAHSRQAGLSRGGHLAKRLFDVVAGSALLVLLLPLFAIVAGLIKLDSDGPVFFRQERVGRNGSVFSILKFRSMYADSPMYERSPSSHADPRLTRVGRLLRRTSFDEAPQLLNVIRGEMSLVGPRPEMPFIVNTYGPVERGRLRAKPGITGLWQISAARAKPIHENVEYDLFYIEHQNFVLDCAILLSTVVAVVRGRGAY
jgi:exopolysaccharide biosynthesis polyprenyl glycosylphosphotransferase